MPTTPFQTYTSGGLIPFYPSLMPDTIPVAIKPSSTLPAGTVVGEIAASPGVYAAYASGHSDGTQTARGILRYAVTTDAGGAITNLGDLAPVESTPMYVSGVFAVADLTGLDATAIASLQGRLIEGDTSTGYFKF